MALKHSALLLCIMYTIAANAQTNFTYSPEKPKPGDEITITYESAGVLEGNLKPVQAVFYALGEKDNADEISMKRIGKKFTGSFKTEPGSNFVYLGFSIDDKFDNNFNNGYTIFLHDYEGKVIKNAYRSAAIFYRFNIANVGGDRDNLKALEMIKKEIELTPEDKLENLTMYASLVNAAKKEEASALLQKEIEALAKAGLDTEEEYQALEDIYRIARLPEQSKLISGLKKERFSNGKWRVGDFIQKLTAEQSFEKSKSMTAELKKKVKNDPDWKHIAQSMQYYEGAPYRILKSKKEWSKLAKELETAEFSSPAIKASIVNDMVWEIQKHNTEVDVIVRLSKEITDWAKNEITNPTETKPGYLTTKDWEKNRKGRYAQYADTYSMVLYKKGDYKKGYAIMKDILASDERKNMSHNSTYALLAEKVLPAKQFQKELAAFVEEGKASTEMVDALKRVYIKQNGSEAGYEQYLADLKKASYIKLLAELKKKMLNEQAPAFALLDLEGKNINVSDLKGKVVVVDFWATWCGPCRASFPGMQKMVDKFRNDPNVKFVFIDTWENVENKQKTVSDFISKNNYSFHVLMDNDSKVVAQFKVEGIPTKFVIDKNGAIRFKSVGFDGSDEKLMTELTAMIELASEASGKTF